MRRAGIQLVWAGILAQSASVGLADNFAVRVVDTGFCDNTPDYRPGMGQFVNNAAFNDPNKAVGAPVGGGTSTIDQSKIVSLGGFGGQIILAFDHDVTDDPANPFGLDAIVFSNTRWISGNPNYHWAEPAHIEIMPELNGNEVPGDDPNERWYLIPGSALTAESWKSKQWPDASFPPLWYPAALWFPNRPDSYTTSGYELNLTFQTVGGYLGVLVNPNVEDADPTNNGLEGFWGYAEYTPTLKLGDRNANNETSDPGDDAAMLAGLFYTTPDDPLTVGITPGAGGGDAFDIAWAVDPANGWQPANLTRFRYIRITCAVDQIISGLGEVSSEIGGVSDVRPMGDLDGDQDVDDDDYGLFLAAWDSDPNDPNRWNAVADIDVDDAHDVDLADYGLLLRGRQLTTGLTTTGEPNGDLMVKAEILDGDFNPGEGYVVIKVSARHTGTGASHRWFNGLRALSKIGGGLWVDPNNSDALEIVQSEGTLVPHSPPTGSQINTESDAAIAADNWETYGGSGQAVEYHADRDTWMYGGFANLLDAPGPDDPNGWTFTATQAPGAMNDSTDLLHLVIHKKVGYDGSPARIYLAGQWGLIGEAPNPAFTGLLAAQDPNAEGDVKVGVLTVRPMATLTLTISHNGDYGSVGVDPNEPSEPPYIYPIGTEVTLTAIPKEGRSFKFWKLYDPNYPGDVNYMTTDSNLVLHLTMDVDRQVEATFKCGSGVEPMLPLVVSGFIVCLTALRRRYGPRG